ncbi:zinc ribbon domain-containing protein [Anatilimnocola floriformis]|uniref:zinc ribbon domain-containing protein n=1 Tax=Anatilimnocola floriformis TaxID=2948575 RepID=UPI0036F40869
MPLIICPECAQKISTAAEACPHCGYPMRPASKGSAATCHACAQPATTRCHRCNQLSCIAHVWNVQFSGAHSTHIEHYCADCLKSHQDSQRGCLILFLVVFAIVVVGGLVFLSQLH